MTEQKMAADNVDGAGMAAIPAPAISAATDHSALSCAGFQRAIEFIGRRWNGAILYVLLDGPCRFNELLARVPNISDRLLTERLRELEAEGMVTREVQPGPPVRVVYELTDAGRALNEVIQSISTWARAWMPTTGE
ncbi:MAG TPA: helix-turn-helix domain-containing protein [Ktedonobacterales bacterium]|nr:helix-turn-helix domain-containing protein [Ktedonobacterales bacterium]